MRGEHLRVCGTRSPDGGSSPHARGAQVVTRHLRHVLRIIPACAGSTANRHHLHHLRWDHPRMRGEHSWLRGELQRLQGSSPHARGALCLAPVFAWTRGIIPACAGSTPRPAGRSSCWRDHPRMRVEHASCSTCSTLNGGSSPHARGARMR